MVSVVASYNVFILRLRCCLSCVATGGEILGTISVANAEYTINASTHYGESLGSSGRRRRVGVELNIVAVVVAGVGTVILGEHLWHSGDTNCTWLRMCS